MQIQVEERKNKQEWKKILIACFKTDKELITKHHIESGKGLYRCVNKTFEDLSNCENLLFYSIKYEGKLCGYFGIENYEDTFFLTGFFIMPKYRNKDFVNIFWEEINKKTDGEFITGIYKKNDKAKMFLEKTLEFVEEMTDVNNNELLIFKSK